MSAKHTPGPWWVDEPLEDGGTEPIVANAQWVICEVADGIDEDGAMEANARLIAAAPDLLAALENLTPILEAAESNASGNPEWKWVSSRINTARAAIAKAEGRQ